MVYFGLVYIRKPEQVLDAMHTAENTRTLHPKPLAASSNSRSRDRSTVGLEAAKGGEIRSKGRGRLKRLGLRAQEEEQE